MVLGSPIMLLEIKCTTPPEKPVRKTRRELLEEIVFQVAGPDVFR